MSKEIVVGKTKANKKLAYRVKEGDALYTIYFVGGGNLPDCLGGLWTDSMQIENAINSYINREKLCKPDQDKKDYKANVRAAKNRPSKLKLKAS